MVRLTMAERNVANTAVAITMTLILVLAVGIPAVDEMAKDREAIHTHEITNSGQPFAFTGENTDTAPHVLTVSLNGDDFIIICDGQIIDTDIGPYQASPELSEPHADLAIGSDALLQVYSSSDVVIQTSAGTVNLGKATDDNISAYIQNGVLTYRDNTNVQGTVNVNLYISNVGDYVRIVTDAVVLNGTTISVNQFGYPSLTNEDTVAVGLIGVGIPAEISQNIQPYNAPNVATVTVTVDSVSNEYYTTIHHMEASVNLVDTEHVSVPVAMFLHASEEYEQTDIIPGGGMLYEITSFIPLLLIFAILMCLVVPLVYVRVRY